MSHYSLDYTRGPLRVAVIGGGISGIVAAHCLSRRHTVTLIEKAPMLGGHTYTARVSGANGVVRPVDMGFIVFNEQNYPTFTTFLRQLGVEHGSSDMSFSYYDPETDFMYAGTGIRGLLARKRNLVSPAFWRMLRGIRRFGIEAKRDLDSGALHGIRLGEYLAHNGYHPDFINSYLVPMTGAIWSASEGDCLRFPAEALVRFFDNHRLLDHRNRPQWCYVRGGSDTYVRAFTQQFQGHIRTDCPVRAVTRQPDGVLVRTDGGAEQFDAVVLATHADEALHLLTDPDDRETKLLAPWRYAVNRVVLHADQRFLPPRKAAWAAWNVRRNPRQRAEAPVGVSYYMNRLQNIQAAEAYVVSLNPVDDPGATSLLDDVVFSHPQYTLEAMATQTALPELDGAKRTFFCGAYQGYGFHEDGAKSGVRVAKHFGVSL